MFSWLQNLFLTFENILERHFSYRVVVIFEDSLIFLFGIYIGAIIMLLIVARIFVRSKKVEGEKFNKISLVRYRYGNSKTFFINDHGSVGEAMRALALIAFSPWFTVKSYTKTDERRTKVFVAICTIIGIIISILAILAISTVTYPIR